MFRRFAFITAALVMVSPPCVAHAVWGIGDTVFDAQVYMQQLIAYATQVSQYATQMQQYSTQIKQLQVQYDNMHSLGYRTDLFNLNEMQRVMSSAMGISNDFSHMQTQFQTLYPDFATYRGQKGADYAKLSAQWSKNNQQNAIDMLTVSTKLQASIAQDERDLAYLNDRSDSASGTKDLLQTMNQLLIMQTKQLFQLQQLIATSAKADAAYLAERSANDEASRAASENIYRGWTNRGVRSPAPEPGHVLQ